MSAVETPLHVFNFVVEFVEDSLSPGSSSDPVVLCRGAFSECSGLEASMEPKEITEGGRNVGTLQRVGAVTFSTVVLKRGITATRDLSRWFELVSGGSYAHRLTATVTLYGPPAPSGSEERQVRLAVELKRCLPSKLKLPDLDATATEVGIEELHLAHEGMRMLPASAGGAA